MPPPSARARGRDRDRDAPPARTGRPAVEAEDERSAGAGHWTFFTNHAHVLFVLAQEPDLRLRDVAQRVAITERAAQRIVRDLEEAGYVHVEKTGRRNAYQIHPQLALRHPVESHCSVADLLRIIARSRRR